MPLPRFPGIIVTADKLKNFVFFFPRGMTGAQYFSGVDARHSILFISIVTVELITFYICLFIRKDFMHQFQRFFLIIFI
jgi:hypothetical protein